MTARHPPPAPGFFAGLRTGLAPLALWAAHFAFCYVATAVGCTALLQGGGITPQTLRAVLALGTTVALAGGAGLLWRACRPAARRGGDLLPVLRRTGALLALVGMAWTGLPLALLPVCGR
ncbi:hypothetical protein [Azohydromonas caseinilytica]|uniref:Uncharacterized protein n=1 Tax=Azohydromonas caseinilytica TaxID=2728836 RepID=A0A848FEK4_9BURK|nr:hypothetical protein [Azohydromonas caseinilytica]NML16580.1 hypothetical protein [Azohydromonas caseinilytica]